LPDNPQIYGLMADILADLPAIGKGSFNEQQRFSFRGIDDTLTALNPILAKHKVFCVPEVEDRLSEERTTARGNTMYVVHLKVRYRFYAPDGSYVEAATWGEGMDSGDKATSKALTMAFKYMLFETFAISTEEAADPDSQTPEPTSGRRPQAVGNAKPVGHGVQKVREIAEKASEIAVKRAQRIHIAAKEAGISEEKLRVRIAQINGGDVSAKALNDAQAQALLKEIEAFKVKQATKVAAEEGA
jgi:hypothetical protein